MCPNFEEDGSSRKRSSTTPRSSPSSQGQSRQQRQVHLSPSLQCKPSSPRHRRSRGDMEAGNTAESTDKSEADHAYPPRLTIPPSSPGLNRWGSTTSQESYRGTSSKSEHELRKCLGSEFEDEVLLKSYSCAWQRDILVHGRLYITQNWFCFYSNILGFETKTSISCFDISAVRKHKTAKVIPNAIQIETGEKKYGFSSFCHRDKTYLVLITIWQNALTKNPLSIESLRQELKTLKVTKEQEKLIMGRRSKSASITSDGSVDYDSSTAVGVADYPSSPATVYHNHSSSDTVTNTMEYSDKEGRVWQPVVHAPTSSTSSSRSATPSEEDGTGSNRDSHSYETLDSDQPDDSSRDRTGTEEEGVDSLDVGVAKTAVIEVPRSPSLLTLRSESPRSGVGVVRGGGSPNMFHHWKQTLNFSSVWRRVSVSRPIAELLSRPAHIISTCNLSQFLNVFISIAIIFMLIYMLTMLCHLSQVNPALQPYLKYQPWCALCSDYAITPQSQDQLSMLSRLLLSGNSNSGGGGLPPPSALPNT